MKIKRTWIERLLSLTPWVTHRPETEIERSRRLAGDLRPSRPMHLVGCACTGNCYQGRHCTCRKGAK